MVQFQKGTGSVLSENSRVRQCDEILSLLTSFKIKYFLHKTVVYYNNLEKPKPLCNPSEPLKSISKSNRQRRNDFCVLGGTSSVCYILICSYYARLSWLSIRNTNFMFNLLMHNFFMHKK